MRIINAIILGSLLTLAACQSGTGDKEEGKGKKTAKVSISEIEAGIKSYIEKETEEGDGYFHLEDGDRELRLKLVRVHTEYLSNLGPDRHFACVDLADEKGDVYDVDFFLEGDPGDMSVTKMSLHKLNGKPFYTWKQRKDKTWHKVDVADASSDLMGVVEGEDEFEFRYEVRLPEITKEAKMWIPIAKSDNYQTVELTALKVPGKKMMLEEEEFDNTVLFLELKPEHSNELVEIVYQVKRKEKGPYTDSTTDPEMYLSSSPRIPVGGRFDTIVNEALEGKEDYSQLMKARALYDYIIDNMSYRKAGKYGTGDANYACDSKGGNCTEFHSFFMSLARTAGIPARFSIGAAIPSERNEGGVDGYHCWAEFYAEDKWWPVDISEGNKYTALATYYFGHHPANRIELSRGRDLKLTPAPASGPVNFLAYPILEVEGEKASAKTTFTFSRSPRKSEKNI